MILFALNLHRIRALLTHFLLISYNFIMKNCVCTSDFTEFRCRILACLNCDNRSWRDQSLISFVFTNHIEIRESFTLMFCFVRTDVELAIVDDLSMILVSSSPIVKFCDFNNAV